MNKGRNTSEKEKLRVRGMEGGWKENNQDKSVSSKVKVRGSGSHKSNHCTA